MPVVGDDRDEVQLPSDHRPDDGREQDIADVSRFVCVAASEQLALRHDLRDDEREQHRDPEPGELQMEPADVDRDVEWMDGDGLAGHVRGWSARVCV